MSEMPTRDALAKALHDANEPDPHDCDKFCDGYDEYADRVLLLLGRAS